MTVRVDDATPALRFRRLGSRKPSVPPVLAVLLLAAALQVAAWAFVVAPLMGPDEIYHTGYVQHLAETGDPPLGGNVAGQSYSTEQANAMAWGGLVGLIGVPEGRPAWSSLEQRRWAEVERSLPVKARRDGTGPTGVGAYPPLYYGYEGVAYAASAGTGFFGQQLVMRLANGLIYLVTIALTWALAGELLGRGRRQVVATALLVLLPQLAFMGGVVNPDTMLIALSTAVLLAGVQLVKRGPDLARVATLATLAALAVLTHSRGVAVIPSALAAVGIAVWVHRPGWRRSGALAALLVGALGVAGLLYTTTTTSVTVPTPRGDEPTPLSVRQFIGYVWQFYLPKLPFMAPKIGPDYGFRQAMVETYFGQFASLEVRFPDWIYEALHAWWLAVAAWLAGVAVVRRRMARANLPILLLIAVSVASLLVVLHLAAYHGMLSTPTDPVIAGRYLLPIAPLGACGVAFVLGSLPRRAFPWASGLVVGCFLLLSLGGLGLTLVRFYA